MTSPKIRNKIEGERLFCGVFPAGWVWADRFYERDGDYARVAFMSYAKLELELENDCPPDLVRRIQSEAARLQAARGQVYQVSDSQYVILGKE